MLGGFRNYNEKEIKIKDKIIEILSLLAEEFGFLKIQTPHIERLTTLNGKGGGDNQKMIYSLDEEKGLRFDLTIPLMRWISENKNDIKLPIKYYRYGSVFRGETQQKGRYREFTQMDFDIVGSKSLICEIDLLNLIHKGLDRLNLNKFNPIISINNKKLLITIFNFIGINQPEVFRIVDKLDKIGKNKVIDELINFGLSNEQIEKLELFIFNDNSLDNLVLLFEKYQISKEGLDEIIFIFNILMESNYSLYKVLKLDLSLVRGMDYYSGMMMEVKLDNYKNSIIGGGRYDNLLDNFNFKNISTIGFSFGIDRIYDIIIENNLIQIIDEKENWLLIPDENNIFQSLALLEQLRNDNIVNIDYYYDYNNKLNKKLDYANRKNYDKVIFFSLENEILIKNMKTGEQYEYSR